MLIKKVDFKEFRNNFKSLKDYEPSDDLKKDFNEFFGIDYKNIKLKIEKDFKENNTYKLFGDLKSKKTLETYKFEIYKPCTVNIRDNYIKNKNFEPKKKEIYEELKKIIDFYLSKKNN